LTSLATAAKSLPRRRPGHLLGQSQHQRLEQQREAGEFAKPVGLDQGDPLIW
jgi:hypothetical protein